MGSLCLWLAVVAAGLLWTAALTAAAARIPPTGWRLVLLALALAVPVLLLALLVAPLVLLQRPGWWIYGISAWLAAIGGGLWILRTGAAERSVADALHGAGGAGEPVAAGWWPVGLLALSFLAASVALGTVAIIDNAASADLAQRQLTAPPACPRRLRSSQSRTAPPACRRPRGRAPGSRCRSLWSQRAVAGGRHGYVS